ncbi:winged helix DNA-binding domain-containing protein [Amycolatopsis sp.]|uniref:winged helix DNA-binding domain-containing protein n=1 Tax=Amycolatopsis sp. TaxID=37632 RepID=UPI002D808512|nr:winged helix DNA-binding domain-containing protein [Amycolatopsis sp.]HET6704821.1 winged helix DNA-binding domain-containing protein [Amycolatopsis sp.]
MNVRAVNRALLARQHLLERTSSTAAAMLGHLVGMQAQAPLAPYVGLWTRLARFRPDELATLLTARDAVRGPLMRGTVHLVLAEDARVLRPLVQRVVAGGYTGHFGRRVGDADLGAVARFGRVLLNERPRTRRQLQDALAARWPEHDAEALSYAVGYLVPTAQVTPRGVWGSTGPATLTTLEGWLGRPLADGPSLEDVVRRYLRAFGPASVADVQAWSGLTKLREVVEPMGLRTFRAESGEVLYDVEDGVRPNPDTPAPARFLPEYDNVLLAHADRARILPPGRRVPLPPGNGASRGTLLVDGFYRADWRLRAEGLEVSAHDRLTAGERAEIEAEAGRLLEFLGAGERSVRITGN